MLERPSLYNQAFYARLETLITDDAQLQMLSSVFDDEQIAKQMQFSAQFGNMQCAMNS
jgi:hypothetical protein